MCAVGAKGDTRKVLANVIGAPEIVGEVADPGVRARGIEAEWTHHRWERKGLSLCLHRYANCPKS